MKYSVNELLFKYLLFCILFIKDLFMCKFYAHQVLTKLVRPLYIECKYIKS